MQKKKFTFKSKKNYKTADKKEESLKSCGSYYLIYDYDSGTISYVHPAFWKITGYDPQTFDIQTLREIIHPDDMEYIIKCEEKDITFKNKLSENQLFNYIFSYSYRIKTASDTYITVRQNSQVLELNPHGEISRCYVSHQLIEEFRTRSEDDYRIYDKAHGSFIEPNTLLKLTKREMEILQLIKEGYNSAEIAEKLCTSKYTIDTHRKNILNKTNSANFIDLIRKLNLYK